MNQIGGSHCAGKGLLNDGLITESGIAKGGVSYIGIFEKTHQTD